MGSSPMKTIAPRVYVAGDRHLKPGILLWIGPMSPRKLARPLPRWRRVHHRHLRLPLPKGLIRRLWPDV